MERALAAPMTGNLRVGRSHNSSRLRAMSLAVISQVNRNLQFPSSVATYSKRAVKVCSPKLLAPCTKGWQSKVPI